jgi:hypothetical protein
MTLRDPKTGKFTANKNIGATMGGRLASVNDWDVYRDTFEALSRALTQAESDVRRYDRAVS